MPRKRPGSESIYQLKITLSESAPSIWRRVLVPTDMMLNKLHLVVQTVMGWESCHLWEFSAGKRREHRFSPPETNPDERDTSKVRLDEIVEGHGRKLHYLYDFGDGWLHEIEIEDELPKEPGRIYPRCTGGARACPPEDSGGVWGYEELLEALADPDHEDRKGIREWLGEDFDPEAFSADDANGMLRRIDV